MIRASRSGAALACAILGATAPALASPLFELTGAVQGSGGHSARVVPAGAASAYFNPAFLADADSGLELGVFVLGDEIGIRLRGRPSPEHDVPNDSVNMERPGGGRYAHYGLPTEWLQRGRPAQPPDPALPARPRQGAGSSHEVRAYQAVGLVQRLFGGRAGLGLYALVPYSRFTGAAAFYSDEREQYFSNSLHPELYADRLTATSLAFGLGVRVAPWLALGASLTLGLRTHAVTPTFLTDVGQFQNILVDSDVAVDTALAPHFGAVLTPAPHTRLCATVHTPQSFQVVTDFAFLVGNGLEQAAKVTFTHSYLPWTFAVGGEHDLYARGTDRFSLAAVATFALWSDYRDRHDQRPEDPYRWSSTATGVVGARLHRGPTRAFFDLTYVPSPVPDQTGRTNYVDTDRAGASAGVSYGVRVLGTRLHIGLQAQAHHLFPRTVDKLLPPASAPAASPLVRDEVPDDAVLGGQPLPGRAGLQTNNPGWPGYSVGGWLLGGGAHLNLSF